MLQSIVPHLAFAISLAALLAYLPLQVMTLRRYGGWAWTAAALPLVGIVTLALILFAQGANLWPLTLFLGAMAGTGWLLVLAFVHRIVRGSWFGGS
ncbi:hypothetical protein [Alsobacter sp. R-9]